MARTAMDQRRLASPVGKAANLVILGLESPAEGLPVSRPMPLMNAQGSSTIHQRRDLAFFMLTRSGTGRLVRPSLGRNGMPNFAGCR